MRWVEDQFRQQNLVGAFVYLGDSNLVSSSSSWWKRCRGCLTKKRHMMAEGAQVGLGKPANSDCRSKCRLAEGKISNSRSGSILYPICVIV